MYQRDDCLIICRFYRRESLKKKKGQLGSWDPAGSNSFIDSSRRSVCFGRQFEFHHKVPVAVTQQCPQRFNVQHLS